MNNEKLIDAIGLIDDKMIADAKLGRIKKHRYLIPAIAAVLVVLIIPSFIFGAGYLFGHLGAGGVPDPMLRYSYDSNKLLSICRINLKATDNKNKKAVSPDYNYKELRSHVGAGIFGVEYADEEKVVITTGKGIFIYNYKQDYTIINFDLDKIGVPGFNQGDSASYIRVDKSGRYCVMDSSDGWGIKDSVIEHRIIDFENGTVRLINEDDIPEDFEPFKTIQIDLYSKKNKELPHGFPGDVAASYTKSDGEKQIFYTNIEADSGAETLVGKTDLVIVSPDKSYTTQRIFANLYDEFSKK